MKPRTARRLLGSVFIGLAASFTFGFAFFDEQGTHLLAGVLIGVWIGIGVFYLSSANAPAD
jgi:hypothetical protein